MNEIKTLSYMIQKHHCFQNFYVNNHYMQREYDLYTTLEGNFINYSINKRNNSVGGFKMHKIRGKFEYDSDKSVEENYHNLVDKMTKEIEEEDNIQESARRLLRDL